MIVVWETDYNKKKLIIYCQMQQHQLAGGIGKILPKRIDMRTRSPKSQDNMDS